MHFNRLAIIDLFSSGHQPMTNEDDTVWLVCDGEIYNYIELRTELINRGHKSKSNSDSESVIHAYEEYGVECLSRFNGMWSFVIYDKRNKKLFCSRDRYGEKPFYYHVGDGTITFSSEIKGILSRGIKAEPNNQRIFLYLAYSYLDINEETMFKNIMQLPPAHYMVIENGKIIIKKYWQLKDEHEQNGSELVNEEDTLCKFRDLLSSSIELRFRSDVPIGILLSGGLDSSAIVSMACDNYRVKNIPIDFMRYSFHTSSRL